MTRLNDDDDVAYLYVVNSIRNSRRCWEVSSRNVKKLRPLPHQNAKTRRNWIVYENEDLERFEKVEKGKKWFYR